MMRPNTRLIAAARNEAPKERRYDPRARGLRTTCTKSLQCIEAAARVSAASGSSTMTLRKNVVKPKVIVLLPLAARSEEHTSELQSLAYLVCRLLLEKKKTTKPTTAGTT